MSQPFVLSQPALVVLVGPSGSGKSTFASRHFLTSQVVSSDQCRLWVSDTEEYHPGTTDAAFRLFHHIVSERLALGCLAVADSTALMRRARMQLLQVAKRHNVPAFAIAFELPLGTCLERDGARGRQVGRGVLERQWRLAETARLSLPSEGYERVFTIGPDNEATFRVEIQPRSLVPDLQQVEEEPATYGSTPPPEDLVAEARRILGDRFPGEPALASARERLSSDGLRAPWRLLLPSPWVPAPVQSADSLVREFRRMGMRRVLLRALPREHAPVTLALVRDAEAAAALHLPVGPDGTLACALGRDTAHSEELVAPALLDRLHADILDSGGFWRFQTPVVVLDCVIDTTDRHGAPVPLAVGFPSTAPGPEGFWQTVEVEAHSTLFPVGRRVVWDAGSSEDAVVADWIRENHGEGRDVAVVVSTAESTGGEESVSLGATAPGWILAAPGVKAPRPLLSGGSVHVVLRRLGQRAITAGDHAQARKLVEIGWAITPEWRPPLGDGPLFGG